VIKKSSQQEIDRAGDRLLREVLEPLGWVLVGIEEDYGIDYDVQVFAAGSPNGLWFKVQLKSSSSSRLSADGGFVSVQLDVDHAKHYALELRDPFFLIHADIQAKRIFWSALQLDRELLGKLTGDSASSTVSVRVPTSNVIPDTAKTMLVTVEKLYLVLGNRTLDNSSVAAFADSLKYQPDEGRLRFEFQLKNDFLKLRRVQEILAAGQFSEARIRARSIVSDPDSAIESRFWAEMKLGGIDRAEAVSKNRPQGELPLIFLNNAKALRALSAKGPRELKFFALISRKAAELDELTASNWGLAILVYQHSIVVGNPIMALNMYAAYALSTRRVIAKYNQCLRLVRYASNFRGRWVLPLALARIVQAAASFVGRIGRMDLMDMGERGPQFRSSVLKICELIAWIGEESADQDTIGLASSVALLGVNSQETDAFKWAIRTLDRISDPEVKASAAEIIDRQVRRWKGEQPKGDSRPDPIQQILENAASSLGIDLSDENDPLVRGLKVAARDNTPERVMRTCEHMVTSLGATGPTARRVAALLGTQMAGSKILHCAIHEYHHEAKDFDSAFAEFKSK